MFRSRDAGMRYTNDLYGRVGTGDTYVGRLDKF